MLIYDSMFNHLTTCTYKLFGLNDSLEPSTISYKVTQSKGSILIEPSTISYTVTQSDPTILSMKANSPTKT